MWIVRNIIYIFLMNEVHAYHKLLPRLGKNTNNQDALTMINQQTLAPPSVRIPPTLFPKAIIPPPFLPQIHLRVSKP